MVGIYIWKFLSHSFIDAPIGICCIVRTGGLDRHNPMFREIIAAQPVEQVRVQLVQRFAVGIREICDDYIEFPIISLPALIAVIVFQIPVGVLTADFQLGTVKRTLVQGSYVLIGSAQVHHPGIQVHQHDLLHLRIF